MWPPWARSPRFGGGGGTATASPAHPSSFFKSPSFKDIYSVLGDGDDDDRSLLENGSSLCPISTASSSPRKPPSPSVFHRVRVATSALRSWRSLPTANFSPTNPSDNARIVLYFTSLRVIRKTFEDCRSVRAILRGFHVAVDERDVSMDARFLTELKGLLRRSRTPGAHLALPRVFIGGRYMGGADEIRQLHECGELEKYLTGVPPSPAGSTCERCDGIRFVLCPGCSGSHKRYSDKGGGGFRTCGSCNENGLVRCPDCCREPDEGI